MKRIILHIGAHKTGSTALQHVLTSRRSDLFESGVLYPLSCNYHLAQHRLAFSLRNMRDPKRQDRPVFRTEFDELRSEIDSFPGDRIIISSEELFGVRVGPAKALREALGDYKVSIVAYVRRSDEMFISNYNQLVKDPNHKFSDHYRKYLDIPWKINPDLMYSTRLSNWAAAFGNDAITVRCYEDVGDVVVDFLESYAIPMGATSSEYTVRMNRGISEEALEIMRIAKAITDDRAKLERLYGLCSRFFPRSSEKYSLLSADDRRRILTAMQKENTHMFSTFLRSKNRYDPSELIGDSTPSRRSVRTSDVVKLLCEIV